MIDTKGLFSALREHAPDDVVSDIAKKRFKVISFDIFDTLIARHISSPDDVFFLLEKRAKSDLGINLPLATIRANAVRKLRRFASEEEPTNKEVSTDEIYKYIEINYAINRKTCDQLHELEKQIEFELSHPRPVGKRLYDAVLESGVPIIIVSDTYYDESHITRVLEKCGYVGFDFLFLSSSGQRTKSGGTIFSSVYAKILEKWPSLKLSEICHIGDNSKNDVENPRRAGWQSRHLPNPIERLRHHPLYSKAGLEKLSKYPAPFRMLVASIAYKFFDEIDADIHPKSFFGGNAYKVGFIAAGVFNFGLAGWIAKEVRARRAYSSVSKVHFLARDGYLPIRFFRKIAEMGDLDVEANYLVSSRRVLYPAQIDNSSDIITAAVKHPIKPHQPLEAIYNTRMSWSPTARSVLKDFEDRRLSIKERHKESFLSALATVGDDIVREAEAAKDVLRAAYGAEIDRDDIMFFDLGYHGTTQKLLSKLFDRHYDFLYVLAEPSLFQVTEDRGRFSSYLSVPTGHYVRKPIVTAVIEAMICASGPSAIGVDIKDGEAQFTFETQPGWGASGVLTLNDIHEGALDFFDWVSTSFGVNLKHFSLEPALAYFFVNLLLRFSPKEDRDVFASIIYDNSITGEVDSLASKRYWLSAQ